MRERGASSSHQREEGPKRRPTYLESWLYHHPVHLESARSNVGIKKGRKVWAEIARQGQADGLSSSSAGIVLRFCSAPHWHDRPTIIQLEEIEAICIGARMSQESIPVRNGKFRSCFTLSNSRCVHIFRATKTKVLMEWVKMLQRIVFDIGRLPPRLCVEKFFDPESDIRTIGMLLRVRSLLPVSAGAHHNHSHIRRAHNRTAFLRIPVTRTVTVP